MNEIAQGVNINKLDSHGKLWSEEKYGTDILSDQKYDFHLANSNQVIVNDHLKMREAYSKNTILGYLHISSLSNKIVSFWNLVTQAPIDILCRRNKTGW